MRTPELDGVQMKTAEILAAVRTNAAKHAKEYQEAVCEYLAACKKQLVARLAEVEAGCQKDDPTLLPTLRFMLVPPEDHRQDYELAIRMLEMCATETLSIDHNTFDCLVLDQWDWRAAFDRNKLSYTTSR